MRHVSRTHRVALDWLFDRTNLDPKIQIKYIDTKTQLADTLTKWNFTGDEWNHLLCLFNISHFSFTDCSEVMSKRTQKDSGEERVTAKSKPMMKLVSRCSERTPDVLALYCIRKPGENQIWKSITSELGDWAASKNSATCWRRLLIKLLRLECWQDLVFSRVEIWWIMEVRTGRPVLFAQHTDRFIVENDDMDSNTAAESEM